VALNFTDLAGSATAAQLGANSVITQTLSNDSVNMTKIASSAVTHAKLSATLGTVRTINIFDAAVTEAKLSNDSVGEAKLQAGAITNSSWLAVLPMISLLLMPCALATFRMPPLQPPSSRGLYPSKLSLSAGEVPADRIGTIPGSQLAANSVTATQILDGTIGTTEIADASETLAKLSADFALPTRKIGDAQVSPAKLAARDTRFYNYPQFI
jgi:hypothetical protein